MATKGSVKGSFNRKFSNICRAGHDKNVTGRLKNRACKLCARRTNGAWRKKQPRAYRLELSKRFYRANREKCLARNRKELNARQEWANEIKLKSGCRDCGYKIAAVALDFDHLSDKVMNISMMLARGYSRETVLAEIAKCEVVCANCHRIRTKQRGI